MSINTQPRDLRVMHYTKEDAIRLTTGRPVSPEEAMFYQAGLDTYGQGFIAFLLATKANDLPATELLDSYQNSHVSFAMSEVGARESLMYAIGIIDGYRHCKEEHSQGTRFSPH